MFVNRRNIVLNMKTADTYNNLKLQTVLIVIFLLLIGGIVLHAVRLLRESRKVNHTLFTASKIEQRLFNKQKALIGELKGKQSAAVQKPNSN